MLEDFGRSADIECGLMNRGCATASARDPITITSQLQVDAQASLIDVRLLLVLDARSIAAPLHTPFDDGVIDGDIALAGVEGQPCDVAQEVIIVGCGMKTFGPHHRT